MWTFVKANLIGVLALILFFILFFAEIKGCGHNPTNGGRDTLQIEKTIVYERQDTVFLKSYTPPIVRDTGSTQFVIPEGYLPSSEYDKLKAQYEAVLKQHLKANKYDDNISLKDSTGKEVGVVNIKDVISENEIKSRTPSYQLSFPHTYTTVTVAESYRQFYGGIAVTGTPAQIVNGGKVGLAYKDKKEKIYEVNVGAMQIQGNTAAYGEIGVKFPLGKKKK